jgi:pyruvate dehydrogenase phosphatase
MIVERASHRWAYSEDIPGSRCGPEDGPWPRSYQVLSEKELWRELRILAKPQSLKLDPEGRYRADSINFQPSPTTKTQDRYVVTQLEVHGRLWTFTGVFDGTYCFFDSVNKKPIGCDSDCYYPLFVDFSILQVI